MKLKNTNFINTKASINDIDINKIVVSNKFRFGIQDFKYFIGYKDSEKIRPLWILRPQIIIYKQIFDLIYRKDENAFLEKYCFIEFLLKILIIINVS